MIEVYDALTEELVLQLNNTHEPDFLINNLNANFSYVFSLYSVNQMGKSNNVLLTVYNDSVIPNKAKIWSVESKH